MRRRPRHRVLQEFPHLGQRPFGEIRPLAAGFQHVPPGAQMVQRDVHPRQRFEGAGEDAVEEHHEGVVDDGAGVAQRLSEADLRAAVGGQVFHQQRALAFRHVALDQRRAAEALGFLAHIGHRRGHAVGDPGGERNARGLAAGHHLDALEADVAVDLLHRQVADLGARAGEIDDPPAVDVDRRLPARGEGVRLVGAEVDRLDLQQDARRGQRRVTIPVAALSGVGGLGHQANPRLG